MCLNACCLCDYRTSFRLGPAPERGHFSWERITSRCALAQIFGSKSPAAGGSMSPCTICEYRASLRLGPRSRAGPFFHGSGSHPCGALAQSFGSKSPGGRRIDVPQGALSVGYRTSFPTWPRSLAGPFFDGSGSHPCGALAQIFGSKSPGGRRIDVPQGALSVGVSYFLSDLAPLPGGAIFLCAKPGLYQLTVDAKDY